MISTWLIALALQGSLDQQAREHHCDQPMAQMDMNACAEIDFERADAELNRVWRALIADVQASDRADNTGGENERRYRAAQRAWIAFRDAECDVAGLEALGGSMEPMLISGCLAQKTRERIAELRAGEAER